MLARSLVQVLDIFFYFPYAVNNASALYPHLYFLFSRESIRLEMRRDAPVRILPRGEAMRE